MSDKRLLLLNKILFVMVLAAIVTNALIHKYLDIPLSILSETCLHGDEGRIVGWPAKTWSIATLIVFQVKQCVQSIFKTEINQQGFNRGNGLTLELKE